MKIYFYQLPCSHCGCSNRVFYRNKFCKKCGKQIFIQKKLGFLENLLIFALLALSLWFIESIIDALTGEFNVALNQKIRYTLSFVIVSLGAIIIKGMWTQGLYFQQTKKFPSSWTQYQVAQDFPLATPITNEVIELWKKSGSTQTVTDWANDQWKIFLEERNKK